MKDSETPAQELIIEGIEELEEFGAISNCLAEQMKEIAINKTGKYNFLFSPLQTFRKEIFSPQNYNLLIELPFRCHETIINAHKDKLSSAQKSILVLTFEEEQLIARKLITNLSKMCVGIDAKDRFDFFKEFEKWFEHLERVFKTSLFQQSELKSDLEYEFMEMAKNLSKLLNRYDVMSCIVKEKFENVAKGLENIGAIPEGTLESMKEVEAVIEELFIIEKELKDACDILKAKVERFKNSQEQVDSNPAETKPEAEPKGEKGKKERGRPKVLIGEAEKRRKIKAKWERYRNTTKGTNKKENFCDDNGIKVEYLNNSVLRWCRDHPK